MGRQYNYFNPDMKRNYDSLTRDHGFMRPTFVILTNQQL